tara:strand:+ start:118 stop:285 length:168 start_codon:yes stop_codon:yes gene_type:complete
MKVLKEKSREYKGKDYHRYRINIPKEIIKKAKIKEGDDLEATAEEGKITLKEKIK